MVYVILLMCIPVLGWTILGIIPTKYINRIVDEGRLRDKSKEKSVKPDLQDNFASFAKKDQSKGK